METAYNYGNAVLQDKFYILGVELRPFSIGHLLILEKMGNLLVSPSKEEISLPDVITFLYQAVLVCSLTYKQNLEIIYDEIKYSELINEFKINLKKNMEVEKDWNILDKLNLFKKYINYHTEMPLYSEERESNSSPSGSDWKSSMVVVFKKLGYTEEQILDMSLKKMFYEWTVFAEGEGAIKVWSKHDVNSYKQMLKNKKDAK